MLFSHGSAFVGRALSVKDRKLEYAYTVVGSTLQTVESTKAGDQYIDMEREAVAMMKRE